MKVWFLIVELSKVNDLLNGHRDFSRVLAWCSRWWFSSWYLFVSL